MTNRFIRDLRRVHTEALEVDWDQHLAEVNRRNGLIGDGALSTADAGLPPAWFNGDVEAIQPGIWTLVVSLNPAKPPAGYYRGELSAETAWDFWRTHNTHWWYTGFFRPLVRLAATALGNAIPSPGAEEREFATQRMVFVELCPYASRKYQLSADVLMELGKHDVGFGFAQKVRRILLDYARPSLVLVNGEDAIKEFALVERERLQWHRRAYSSDSSQQEARSRKAALALRRDVSDPRRSDSHWRFQIPPETSES